jgi:hypothetical protein
MAPRLVIDGILPRWLHARTVFSPAPARAVNIVAPGILYISKAYIDLTVGDINDQFRHRALAHSIPGPTNGQYCPVRHRRGSMPPLARSSAILRKTTAKTTQTYLIKDGG